MKFEDYVIDYKDRVTTALLSRLHGLTLPQARLLNLVSSERRRDLNNLSFLMGNKSSDVARIANRMTPDDLVYYGGFYGEYTIELGDKGLQLVQDIPMESLDGFGLNTFDWDDYYGCNFSGGGDIDITVNNPWPSHRGKFNTFPCISITSYGDEYVGADVWLNRKGSLCIKYEGRQADRQTPIAIIRVLLKRTPETLLNLTAEGTEVLKQESSQ